MADKPETEAEASAEKAYAAAAEAVSVKPEPVVEPVAEPAPAEVEFPSKAKRAAKPKAAAKPAAKPAAKKAAKPAVAKTAPKPKPVAKPKPAAKTKPVAAKAPAKAKPKAAAKPKPKPKTPAKPASTVKPAIAAKTMFQQLKDKTMDTAEFTSKMKSAVAEVQEKAKEALDKGAAAFSEYNEFSKGNLEAVVESGKILATGMQSLGTSMVADSKAAFDTLTSEVKELTSVKTPADFFKLQTEFMKRNFDSAVALTSKNSEAVLKVASDAAAPISGRFSLAVEKIKKAA